MGRGLILGKFLPPHRGHRLVVETALARCQEVVITILSKSAEPIAGELRAAWLRELFPTVSVRHRVCDHHEDYADDTTWRYWVGQVQELVPEGVDMVFSSEAYGMELAGRLGAEHVAVDPDRRRVRVSGAMVRRDPLACWEWLEGPVRAHYAVRVSVVGAESTGTTTLARDLAVALDAVWVPEYGRDYTVRKLAAGDVSWRTDEFTHIATEQARVEDLAVRTNPIVVLDTDAFATALWHERYMGRRDPDVDAVGRDRVPDLYLITGNEIPFVQDGHRDGEHVRHAMHDRFAELIPERGAPWAMLRGSREARLAEAVRLVGGVLDGRRMSESEARRWETAAAQAG